MRVSISSGDWPIRVVLARFGDRVYGIAGGFMFGEQRDGLSYRPGNAVLALPTQRHCIEEPWMAPE